MSATLSKRSKSASPAQQRRVARSRRHFRVRRKVFGTPERPRLVVTRSLKHMFVQLVDDNKGHTLASASTMDPELRGSEGDKTAKAKQVGEMVAERAKSAGIEAVVFDRAGYAYHGRIAALADAARESGLSF